AEQINEIRDNSQNYKFARDKKMTVWGQHYAEMGRKTVLRRLVKYLPVSIELAQAAALDELSGAGRSQALDNVLEGDYITPVGDDDEDDAGDEQATDQQTAPSSAAQAETTKPAPAAGAAPEYLDADKVLASIKAAQDHDVLAVAADSIQDCDPARAADLK